MNDRRLLAEARAITSPAGRFRGLAASGAVIAAMAAAPGAAQADVWATNFESSSYTAGQHINGQAGWSDTDLHDANVVNVASYPNAAAFGFGSKAFQISNFKTDGAFGGQPFTPSTGDEAGEPTADNAGWSGGIRQSQFKARFRIGVADPTPPGSGEDRHVSISADRGDGARMSYLRFEDQADGIHVFFEDVPSPTTTLDTSDNKQHVEFVETDIGTLDRTQAHLVTLSIDFVDGPTNGAGNDVVTVHIENGATPLDHTGTTWENYYRHDEEQQPAGNKVPTVDSLLLREAGANNVPAQGKGFLLDDFRLESTSPGAGVGPPGQPGTPGTSGATGATGATGPTGPAGQSTPASPPEPNPVTVVSNQLRANKKHIVNLTISCPKAAGLCDGRARLAVGKTTRGSSSFLVNGGRKAVLRLRLSTAAIKSAIKRKKVTVAVFSRDNGGAATLTQKSVKFVK